MDGYINGYGTPDPGWKGQPGSQVDEQLPEADDVCYSDPDGVHFAGCGCDYTSPDDPAAEPLAVAAADDPDRPRFTASERVAFDMGRLAATIPDGAYAFELKQLFAHEYGEAWRQGVASVVVRSERREVQA